VLLLTKFPTREFVMSERSESKDLTHSHPHVVAGLSVQLQTPR
jgi:hypothetical protein